MDSDSAMNWDDVADLAGNEDKDIPAEVQDKLLSDYERELSKGKSKNTANALSDEIAELALKDEEEAERKRQQQEKSERVSPGSTNEKGEEGEELFFKETENLNVLE